MHDKTLTWKNVIIRQSWLMAIVVFALLVQIQQTLACDMMIDTPAPAGDHCIKHDTGENPADKTMPPCCDLSKAFTVKTGHCFDGQEVTLNNYLLGKLNPDFHLVIVLFSTQNVIPPPYLTSSFFIPDRNASRPGTRTYLSTRRLRI
jgi:hypothetical protein